MLPCLNAIILGVFRGSDPEGATFRSTRLVHSYASTHVIPPYLPAYCSTRLKGGDSTDGMNPCACVLGPYYPADSLGADSEQNEGADRRRYG
jgi:hypothetical protein